MHGGRWPAEKGVWESGAPLPGILTKVSWHLCSSPAALSDWLATPGVCSQGSSALSLSACDWGLRETRPERGVLWVQLCPSEKVG